MSQLQTDTSKSHDDQQSAPQKDGPGILKRAAGWGLLIVASAGVTTGVRSLVEQIVGTAPAATSTLDHLSPAQTETLLNIVSHLSETQGISLETVKAEHPSGYLESKLLTLTKNFSFSESFGELTAIGKAAIPFLEDAASTGTLSQEEVVAFYGTLSEIGGNEAASSILRIFTERARRLNEQELAVEFSCVCHSMVSTNSALGHSLIKDILQSSERPETSDAIGLRCLAVTSISESEWAVPIPELEAITLNRSNPVFLRSSALNALIGRGMDPEKVERLVLTVLKDDNDPLFQRARSVAVSFARPELLPYVIETALSERANSADRQAAVKAIGHLGAQRYAPDLISLLSTNDQKLSAQILDTVLTIGTADNINQLIQRYSERGDLGESFPYKSFRDRLLESERMAAACRPALQIVLNDVFPISSTGDTPITKESYQAAQLLQTMIRCELGGILKQFPGGLEQSNYPDSTDQYRASIAKLVFELSLDKPITLRLDLQGIGLLAPFASEQALRAVALYTLGYSETEIAVRCLGLMKDAAIDKELLRIASAPDTNEAVRLIITAQLAPERGTFFKRTKRVQDTAPLPSESSDANDLNEVTIPPLDTSKSPEEDFFSTHFKNGLDQSLPVHHRTQSLLRILILDEAQSKELLPLLADNADAIRIAAACAIAKHIPRSSFSEAEVAAINRALLEGLNRHLNGDYSRILSPITSQDIEEAILGWKSPAVTEFLCATLDRAQGTIRHDIRQLLNPLLNDDSDLVTFADHISKKLKSLPANDAYAKVLNQRLELLLNTRAIGLQQPFRFSDTVQKTIVQDMQPSADDKRPVVILCFAEADHNQAATQFNRQIEEMIEQGFRVLVMEPGSRSELEESSLELKKIIATSGLAGAIHIFKFGHGQTEGLQLGDETDEAESMITSGDPRGLPHFSTLLAPEGGVTLLSCSTGGQISNEINLLSYYRTVVFPQAAQGHIRAPVLPTYLSGIILTFSENGHRVENVTFPVQTSEL
jgi:HEAT repeat protein